MPQQSSVKTTFAQKVSLLLLGIGLMLIVMEVFLRLAGGIFFYIQEHRNKIPEQSANVYRVLCIGESTTALGGESSYPTQLEELLNAKSKGRKFKVINKGLPAKTTTDILANIDQFLSALK